MTIAPIRAVVIAVVLIGWASAPARGWLFFVVLLALGFVAFQVVAFRVAVDHQGVEVQGSSTILYMPSVTRAEHPVSVDLETRLASPGAGLGVGNLVVRREGAVVARVANVLISEREFNALQEALNSVARRCP